MRAIILFLTLAAMVNAHAEQDTSDIARSVFQNEIKNASVQPATATAVSEGNSGTANPVVGTPKTSGGNSINPAAQTGKSSQGAGAMINMAAGAALIAACMSSSPPNWGLCAMGAQALAQGAADKSAAGQSAATFDASQFETQSKPTYTDPAKGVSAFSSAKVKEGLAAMKDAGYTVTDAGVKLPDGTFVPSSALGNSASASAFGAGAVREAQKVTAAVNDEISKMGVSSVAVDSSGGGGSADAGAVGAEESSSGAGGGLGLASLDGDRKRLMAGKTVNFDGEPIGVRGNNIFEMVHDCYQKKRAGNHFIEGESAAVRTPASVPARKK